MPELWTFFAIIACLIAGALCPPLGAVIIFLVLIWAICKS